jgi:hypothetical protein
VNIDNQKDPWGVGSDQYDDIVEDLEAHQDDRWIVVYLHQPVYCTTCTALSQSDANAFRDVYQPLFDEYGVDLVLQGHSHLYERIKPMAYENTIVDDDADDDDVFINPDGQVYVTVGTGGKQLSSLTPTSDDKQDKLLYEYGFLKVSATQSSLAADFIRADGAILDSFSIVQTDIYDDSWATSMNTADYVNNYQIKLGMKIQDVDRRDAELHEAKFFLQKGTAAGTYAGTITAELYDLTAGTTIATSTNSVTRSTMSSGSYVEHTFTFADGTMTPANDFFVGLKCNSCDADKTFLGARKIDNPYADGNEIVFRSGAWNEREPDAFGSAEYEK